VSIAKGDRGNKLGEGGGAMGERNPLAPPMASAAGMWTGRSYGEQSPRFRGRIGPLERGWHGLNPTPCVKPGARQLADTIWSEEGCSVVDSRPLTEEQWRLRSVPSSTGARA